MGITAIVGANWGDEGKGKITDLLAKESDFVVRFQGGNNAGHTIINNYGKFKLHLLPSGVFHQKVTNILANGVAINIEAFLDEYNNLLKKGVPKPQIIISSRAQVVLPQHILFDKLEEKRLGLNNFGSTQTGMAPFYADKYLKIGIQVIDLFNYHTLLEKVKKNIILKNILLTNIYNEETLDAENITKYLFDQGQLIKKFVGDTRKILTDNIERRILMEGQLGALKDPDHGIYPMTTSSSTLSSFSAVSCGLPGKKIDKVISVVKSYSTCVGNGPFVTEIFGNDAEELRLRGGDAGEFGATTGRPRRMGWFDAVATKYGCEIQGTTDVTLSLLDVLSYLDEIPICVSYKINNEISTNFPTNIDLEKAIPVYKYLSGWKCNITSVKRFEDLPKEAKIYIKTIENLIGFKISYISVGPDRDDIIYI